MISGHKPESGLSEDTFKIFLKFFETFNEEILPLATKEQRWKFFTTLFEGYYRECGATEPCHPAMMNNNNEPTELDPPPI